jgi:hypothetical protein
MAHLHDVELWSSDAVAAKPKTLQVGDAVQVALGTKSGSTGFVVAISEGGEAIVSERVGGPVVR